MSAQDHGRWQDELAAYVLGSLDPAESEQMERHLESCAECRERFAEHRCPNCNGVLTLRPPRARAALATTPASRRRVFNPNCLAKR